VNAPAEASAYIYRGPFLYVWVGLMAATMLSFWLGTDHGISSDAARNALLLAVAFLKVRFVGLYFMELKDAPWALRGMFEFYCVAVCSVLIGWLLVG
jgi:hypothetical protein